MKKLHLVSFYGQVNDNDAFHSLRELQHRQTLLNQTALKYGDVAETHSWTLDKLKTTQYYADNIDILSRSRGCGYWAWKPYIILDTLVKIPENDYVIYCDIGRPHDRSTFDYGNQITCSLQPLADWAEQNRGVMPGVYLPHHGQASKWIKADCFHLMDCTAPDYQTIPTIQAGYTVWKNTPSTREFLQEWQALNLDSRLISDDENSLTVENSQDFIRHCHDQATLTLLCAKKQIQAFGDKNFQFWGFRNINFIAKRASFELKKQSKTLSFPYLNQQHQYLPKFLNQWVELIFCDRTTEDLNALVLNSEEYFASLLKHYLPNVDIETNLTNRRLNNYDLVITKDADDEVYTSSFLIEVFNMLSQGGIAILGPLPSVGSSFEEYAKQVAKTEAFSVFPGVDSSIIPTQILKIHNSRNPIFLRSGQTHFVLMYKPHTILKVN